MPTLFGPQLIGETEKTLSAILRKSLSPTSLTEPQWVALRVVSQIGSEATGDDLARAVADRAHFPDASDLVRALTARGLLHNGRPTSDGRQLMERVQATIDQTTAPIWHQLPDDEVTAATRLLDEIITRARRVLGESPDDH